MENTCCQNYSGMSLESLIMCNICSWKYTALYKIHVYPEVKEPLNTVKGRNRKKAPRLMSGNPNHPALRKTVKPFQFFH